MNPKLTFEYKKISYPEWSGTTCIIGIEGQRFTQQGLPKKDELLDRYCKECKIKDS